MEQNKQMPDLYSYEDYRKFLRDRFAYLKAHHRAFSFRFFAREAGLASQSTLKFVMDGERNLSQEIIPKICKGLKFTKNESEFFEALVGFTQAKNVEDKNRFYERMKKNAHYRKVKSLESKQYEYFSKWYHPVIRELVAFADFEEDSVWIAKKVFPPIEPKEAMKSLQLLLELGLVARNAQGKLVQADTTLTTGHEVSSLAVKNFHVEMSKQAVGSLDSTQASERDISGMILGIPVSKMPELKKRIHAFKEELAASLGTLEESPEMVAYLSLQLFPLSERPKKLKKEKK